MIHLLLLYLMGVTYPTSATNYVSSQYDKSVTTVTSQPSIIGEVVVFGKKPEISPRITLDGKELETVGIKSSDQIEELSPILSVEDTSRGDRYIYLSGFNYKEIQLYLDGVPFYIPYSGDVGADIVKLVNIKKVIIEPILPSLLYGPNAMGGAINILSATPREGVHGKMSIEYSDFNAKDGLVNVSGKESRIYGSASLYGWNSPGFPLSHDFTPDLNEDGGLRNNSYSKGYTFFGTTGYEKDDANFATLRYYKTSMEKGVPPEVGSDRPRYWRFTDWEKDLLNFIGRKSVGDNYFIRFNTAYIGYYNVLDAYDDDTYTTQTARYAFHSTYDDHSIWSSLIGGYETPRLSVNSLLIYKKDIHREQPDYNEPWQEYGEETYSAGLKAQFRHRNLLFISEGRYDYLAAFDHPNADALNYRFSLKYTLNKGEVSAIFGSTTRFPTMKERYSDFKREPNPNLKPEKQNAVVLTGKYSVDIFRLYSYVFYSRLTDLIDSVYISEDLLQNQNIGKATIEGFYISGSGTKDNLTLNVALQGLWARNETDDYILPYRPRWKVNILGSYDIGKVRIGTGLTGQFITFYQDSHTLEIYRLPSWYTVMAFIEYTPWDNVTIYVRGTNLLDRNYETEHNFPAPGREIYAGIKGEF